MERAHNPLVSRMEWLENNFPPAIVGYCLLAYMEARGLDWLEDDVKQEWRESLRTGRSSMALSEWLNDLVLSLQADMEEDAALEGGREDAAGLVHWDHVHPDDAGPVVAEIRGANNAEKYLPWLASQLNAYYRRVRRAAKRFGLPTTGLEPLGVPPEVAISLRVADPSSASPEDWGAPIEDSVFWLCNRAERFMRAGRYDLANRSGLKQALTKLTGRESFPEGMQVVCEQIQDQLRQVITDFAYVAQEAQRGWGTIVRWVSADRIDLARLKHTEGYRQYASAVEASGEHPSPLSYALVASQNWARRQREAQRMAALAGEAEAPAPGTVVYRFDDGWTIQRLDTEEDYETEGEVMDHCVAEFYEEEGADYDIYSLRDPEGWPHATLEWKHVENYAPQARGMSNVVPRLDYLLRLWCFRAAVFAPRYRPVGPPPGADLTADRLVSSWARAWDGHSEGDVYVVFVSSRPPASGPVVPVVVKYLDLEEIDGSVQEVEWRSRDAAESGGGAWSPDQKRSVLADLLRSYRPSEDDLYIGEVDPSLAGSRWFHGDPAFLGSGELQADDELVRWLTRYRWQQNIPVGDCPFPGRPEGMVRRPW